MIGTPLQQKAKIKAEMQAELSEALEKIQECRDYLMTTPKEQIKVEEALLKLGFNENGY